MHLVILTQVLDQQDAVLGFFHRWCDVFARNVDRLTVIAHRVGRVELPENVRVVSLGKESGAGGLSRLRTLLGGLGGLRDEQRPDAVLVHMVPRLGLAALPATLPRGVPLYLWYTHKGVDLSLRLAAPLMRKVFTASRESFRLPIQEERLVITGHGIDCGHFGMGTGPRPVDVVCVGRLAPSKAQDDVLKGLALMRRCPSAEFVGGTLLEKDEAYRDRLEALVRMESGLAGRVRFLGPVAWRDVAAVMRRARVLVDASRTGSVDKVILEAMAAGTIPLTCNEAFVPLLGVGFAERLIYDKGDLPGMASRLARLLALAPDERDALARELRERVLAEHDLERLIPTMVAHMAEPDAS
ncbi:MAG: glycosyltransferase family 4 protein [Planctomycetota bacterium]|jgi:glycosyltransferase involved in cell wall biosynthesis